jgi:hypothetical protein
VLEARVYHNYKSTSLDELKEKNQMEIKRITKQKSVNAISHLTYRPELVIEQPGGLIQPFLLSIFKFPWLLFPLIVTAEWGDDNLMGITLFKNLRC